jgi:DNA repair protein RadC
MNIKNISKQELPREKILKKGTETLTNEELLMVIIGSGQKTNNVKQLALEVLSIKKNINDLSIITYDELSKIKGLKEAKATKILSAIELGKRINTKDFEYKEKIKSAEQIYEKYKPILLNEKQEYFYCLYLNVKNEILAEKLLFKGTINYSVVHPREIFKNAYLLSATSIICFHNHPSMDTTPSEEDIILTKKINEISKIFGIKFIDHIIIGEGFFSFHDNCLID